MGTAGGVSRHSNVRGHGRWSEWARQVEWTCVHTLNEMGGHVCVHLNGSEWVGMAHSYVENLCIEPRDPQ